VPNPLSEPLFDNELTKAMFSRILKCQFCGKEKPQEKMRVAFGEWIGHRPPVYSVKCNNHRED
jgi:hypothetical protein